MFFVVCAISIISTSMPDWWWWIDSTSGVHEGLWSTCYGHNCASANEYSGGCQGLLNVVRAFSVMTILFSFFTLVCTILMLLLITSAAIPGIIFGLLTVYVSFPSSLPDLFLIICFFFAEVPFSFAVQVCCSVIPWSVYLGFLSQCVAPGIHKGSGWSLAVAALPIASVGLLLMLAWLFAMPPRPSATPLAPMSAALPWAQPCLPMAPMGQPMVPPVVSYPQYFEVPGVGYAAPTPTPFTPMPAPMAVV